MKIVSEIIINRLRAQVVELITNSMQRFKSFAESR